MARTVGSTAAQTRQRVLDAALDLFAERSYAGTSVRDIAERVGMTKASLYYHFAGKEELLRALASPLLTELAQCSQLAGSGATPRRVLRKLVDVLDDHRRLVRGTLYDPSARRVMAENRSIFAEISALEPLLARSDSPADMLRARCAIGAVRGAVMPAAEIGALARNEPPDLSGDGPRPRLSEVDRAAVAASAVAALRAGASRR